MDWFVLIERWYAVIAFVSYILVVLLVGGRILMSGKTVGATLAWILLVIILPLVGALLYVILGESFIGQYRQNKAKSAFLKYIDFIQNMPLQPSVLSVRDDDPAKPLWDQTYGSIKLPPYCGNATEILSSSNVALDRLLEDIKGASKTIFIEFYICHEGGRVDPILDELVVASKRGVNVCLILDSIGSRDFIAGEKAIKMVEQGVVIVEALKATFFRLTLRRRDLRMHRKLIVIDCDIAYTGSMNLADPEFFNQDANVGEWIDLMVRIRGPVIPSMERVFINDWLMEGRLDHVESRTSLPLAIENGIPIQVVPSGPAIANENLIHLLLLAIYNAKASIDITTPYFVPDDSIILALKGAALRGVKVSIYLPFKNDSWLAKYAGHSFYEELLISGVRICPFRDGLLHTKCVLIDKQIALVGSVNLDMRSIWLNFEITIVVSSHEFCSIIDGIIEEYNSASDTIDLERWRTRSISRKIIEQLTRLLSPLL